MDPYERLPSDAAHGDAILFARQEAVEAAWRVVDRMVGNATPAHQYEPKSWGPGEADARFAADGAGTTSRPRRSDRASALSRLHHLHDGRPDAPPGRAGGRHTRWAGNQQHRDRTVLQYLGCDPAQGKLAEGVRAARCHGDGVDD